MALKTCVYTLPQANCHRKQEDVTLWIFALMETGFPLASLHGVSCRYRRREGNAEKGVNSATFLLLTERVGVGGGWPGKVVRAWVAIGCESGGISSGFTCWRKPSRQVYMEDLVSAILFCLHETTSFSSSDRSSFCLSVKSFFSSADTIQNT